MIIVPWIVRCGLWKAPFDAAFLAGLREDMVANYRRYSRGDTHWMREEHNIFDQPGERVSLLRDYFLDRLEEYAAPCALPPVASLRAREIVRPHGEEILVHADRHEGHLSAHLVLDGDDLPSGLSDAEVGARVNRFCPNAIAVCDPGADGMDQRMPWEGYSTLWIKPHRGLFVLYPSKLRHFVRPYLGDGLFVQITMSAMFQARPDKPWELLAGSV